MSIIVAPTKPRRLFTNGTSVGNGADLTADTLHSFTIAAGQLANVGDTLRIKTGGTLGGTTDTKTMRVVVGGTILTAPQATATASTAWSMELVLTKTGTNTQSYVVTTVITSGTSKVNAGTLALTDANTITVAITGQNTTNSVAGSITAQLTTIDFN